MSRQKASSVKNTLSANVKQFRKKLGLSQDKLARLADVPYVSLIKIEHGKILNPSIDTLSKLADAFDISIDDLVGRKAKPPSKKSSIRRNKLS